VTEGRRFFAEGEGGGLCFQGREKNEARALWGKRLCIFIRYPVRGIGKAYSSSRGGEKANASEEREEGRNFLRG